MPQNTTKAVPAATWTQITDADVSAITFQLLGNSRFWVKGTTDGTAPTDTTGAIIYQPGQGERNVSMTALFPGLTGADRLWCYTETAGQVVVHHA